MMILTCWMKSKFHCNQVSKEEVMEDLKCLVSSCKLQSLTSHVRTRVPAGVELHVFFFSGMRNFCLGWTFSKSQVLLRLLSGI